MLTIYPLAARDAHVAGRRLQHRLVRLAVLEQERPDERELDRSTGPEVVVECQQLANPIQAGSKREEGLVPSMSSLTEPEEIYNEGPFKYMHMSSVAMGCHL